MALSPLISQEVGTVVGHVVNALAAASFAFIGRQFQKNRLAGRKRDLEVRRLTMRVTQLADKLSSVEREVDRDRAETRHVLSTVRELERLLVRLGAKA